MNHSAAQVVNGYHVARNGPKVATTNPRPRTLQQRFEAEERARQEAGEEEIEWKWEPPQEQNEVEKRTLTNAATPASALEAQQAAVNNPRLRTGPRIRTLRQRFQAEERAMQEEMEKEIKWKWESPQAQDNVERGARTNAPALPSALQAREKRMKWTRKWEPLQTHDSAEKRTQTKAATLASGNTDPLDYAFSISTAEAVKRKQRQLKDAQIDVVAAFTSKPNSYGLQSTIVASRAFLPEGNRHHKSPATTTSKLGDLPSAIDHKDEPESRTPSANKTVHLPPQNSQFDTTPRILSSHKPPVPKRSMDLEFMMSLAKLRQRTKGTSSVSSTSQGGEKYMLRSPASLASIPCSESFSIASTLSAVPEVEFPPTPIFTDERIPWPWINRN